MSSNFDLLSPAQVGSSGPDYSDLHGLFAADWSVNSARSNKDFGDCLKEQTASCQSPAHPDAAQDTADDIDSFLPPLEVRGDIARALMCFHCVDFLRADRGDAAAAT